ncbi:MAG TPA: glycine radical domain-containing protein, partial [Clostridia bacterium]|nr:glycine radical domain-containing protein [Clostridia bacterium]
VSSFISTLMAMGGTLLNINIVDKKKILEAHKDPLKYPNLIVRVTGFSAYFASLSKDFRQLVVDRIVEGL